MIPEPNEFALYHVCWLDEGETKKSHAMFLRNAHNRMRMILSGGQPAWIQKAEQTFLDDDIPF